MSKKEARNNGRQVPEACIVRVPPSTWFLFALLAGIGLQRILPLGLLLPPAYSMVGWVVVGLGMALLAWSELQFARHKTSHNRRATVSTLITTGPFRFSRNPVYIGLFVLLAGLAVALNTLWILFFAPLSLLVMQFHVVPREEACLEQMSPEAYPSYRQAVRRWL